MIVIEIWICMARYDYGTRVKGKGKGKARWLLSVQTSVRGLSLVLFLFFTLDGLSIFLNSFFLFFSSSSSSSSSSSG